MYKRFFGLSERPFELTSNPKYLFFTPQHREALANLEYGIASAKAITVVIGEAGLGKTTLLRAALQSEQCRHVRSVVLDNPTMSRAEFVRLLATRLGLRAEAAESKAVLLNDLETELRARRARKEMTALIVDEAQSLGRELLEELRLLANIETESEKLLPLVLVGQPELAQQLNEPGLRQLKQRVALRCEITALSLPETALYIASRIRTAGGNTTKLFTREAVMLIHEVARGIPRTINVICDNALINAFALNRQPVDRDMVLDACRDLDLTKPESESMPESEAVAHPHPTEANLALMPVDLLRTRSLS
jgi:general secretion pathway protein A